MRPQVIQQTGTGSTAWIPLDYKQSPFNVGFGVVVSGTITYDVEHTFDDVYNSTITPTAFKHSSLTSQTTNKDSNYAFPVPAVLFNLIARIGNA